eukprot:6192061-Pleurochrysis_carterae.AAC.5
MVRRPRLLVCTKKNSLVLKLTRPLLRGLIPLAFEAAGGRPRVHRRSASGRQRDRRHLSMPSC